MQLVLSLFSGIGLLDRAFKEKGFFVVSAGDLILGQDIRDFHAVAGKFDGVIGGSPCQDFSTLNRNHRTFRELCSLQGLEDDFNLPDFNMAGKKKAVGNGVPLVLGRVLADAVLNVTGLGRKECDASSDKSVTVQRCKCGCKRVCGGRKTYYDYSCRKRTQRRRER